MDAMKDYPTLGLIVRHGKVGGVLFVLVAAIIALWIALPLGIVPAVAIAALVAFGGGILVMSYVEIVRLITEMMLPQ
jgi:hypothetical protein